MKLNKKDLNNYRRVINESLKDVDELHSIKLPNEVIDELFFGTVTEGKVKKFEYSFSAISALDLSDYSFENVSFDSDIPVNLSNTNAKIDFHKTYEYKHDRSFNLRNIDFSKTDLSEANLGGIKKVDYCDLSNTNIYWPTDYFRATYSDFTNTNMSSIFIPLTALTKYGYSDPQSFEDCILTNTKIHLKVKTNEKIRETYGRFPQDVINERNKIISEMTKNGALIGCYINGVLLKTDEEYSKERESIKSEYESFKSKKTNQTLTLIKSQTTPSTGGKSIL